MCALGPVLAVRLYRPHHLDVRCYTLWVANVRFSYILLTYFQEHSANRFNYNRKKLHRGICVSKRCPSDERNSSWRFERCVQQETSSFGLKAALRNHNCESSAVAPKTPDHSQRTFLAVVSIILCLNFVGTLYDWATGGNGGKYTLHLYN